MLQDEIRIIVKDKTAKQGIPDYIIDQAVEEAEYAIRNYCGRWHILEDLGDRKQYEELPRGLKFIWAQMAVGIIDLNKTTASDNTAVTGGVIQSIKEGDTQITYATGSAAVSTSSTSSMADTIMEQYKNDLTKYCRFYHDVKEV